MLGGRIAMMASQQVRRSGRMERGPLGERFTTNIRELRDRLRLGQEGLADRMAALGHPLGVNAVSRMEKGERRADVSELVALAIALEVTPDRLLLGGTASPNDEVALTSTVQISGSAAWYWATGRAPLPDGEVPEIIRTPDLWDFQEVNRPYDPPNRTLVSEMTEYTALLDRELREAADRLWRKGVPPRILSAYLDQLAYVVQLRYQDGEEGDDGEHPEAP
jgi:transcriptional regulator with XRE-family HTH domain